jgi:cystathionine beta-lyase
VQLHIATSVEDPYGASSAPLYQTATFKQPSSTTNGPYDYTRSGNPTRTMLEETMAMLEVSGFLSSQPSHKNVFTE